jgi:hypothetical protein
MLAPKHEKDDELTYCPLSQLQKPHDNNEQQNYSSSFFWQLLHNKVIKDQETNGKKRKKEGILIPEPPTYDTFKFVLLLHS